MEITQYLGYPALKFAGAPTEQELIAVLAHEYGIFIAGYTIRRDAEATYLLPCAAGRPVLIKCNARGLDVALQIADGAIVRHRQGKILPDHRLAQTVVGYKTKTVYVRRRSPISDREICAIKTNMYRGFPRTRVGVGKYLVYS